MAPGTEPDTQDAETSGTGGVWILTGTTHVRVHQRPDTVSDTLGRLDNGRYQALVQTRGEFVKDASLFRASSFWVYVEDAEDTVTGELVSGWISAVYLDHPVAGVEVDP